jgi:type III pantothenate kinase
LSAESLFQKTALLPRIHTIQAPRALIGKDTKASILSGLFFGYGAMCCGLIDQITKKIKGNPKVIVTGGHTRMMKKFIARKITKIDKDLVFKGMGLLVA